MKNYEKYAEEIRNIADKEQSCALFIIPKILKQERCSEISCNYCRLLQVLWLMEEYEEPETDWSKVAVDTPILVKDREGKLWTKRYFAKYKDGKVYAWNEGCTSWSTSGLMSGWKYAELAEGDLKNKAIDWSDR